MPDVTPCNPKSHAVLAEEWDRLAVERHRQIASGDDLSFEHILVPTALSLLGPADKSVVLDIGSGTGDFTARLAAVSTNVIAIEPSRRSLTVARESYGTLANVRFIQGCLEESVASLSAEPLTAAVAAMTLMTTPDLPCFARALGRLLPLHSLFVATLAHPWFWPRYWGYESDEWFRYDSEIFIEAPFEISRCRTMLRTTHIHRPLKMYVNAFAAVGFELDAVAEPMPSSMLEKHYPKPWRFPRFLGLRWVKRSEAGSIGPS